MPPVLGISKFSGEEYARALDNFHLTFGSALTQWARVEERVGNWFWYSTGLSEEMARAIFYSARNFNARADMLEAALRHAEIETRGAKEFIKSAIHKAVSYSSFRNVLAHGEPTFDAQATSPTFKQILLLQGKHTPPKAIETGITVSQL